MNLIDKKKIDKELQIMNFKDQLLDLSTLFNENNI